MQSESELLLLELPDSYQGPVELGFQTPLHRPTDRQTAWKASRKRKVHTKQTGRRAGRPTQR